MKNNKKALWLLPILLLAGLLLLLPSAQATLDEDTCIVGGAHTWGDWYTFEEATCTSTGSKQCVCLVCGWVQSQEIPALGHAWDGGKVTTAATCTTDGVMTYTCTRCGATTTEAIPALGHKWVNNFNTQPTCTEPGMKGWYCDVCDMQTNEEIPATGHTPVTVPGKAATCTEAGITDGSKCSVCGVTLTEQTAIPALGHSPVTVAGKAATCTEAGLTEGSTCGRCGILLTAQTAIPALGHSWNGGVVTTQATCTTAGTITYTCTRCGMTYTDTIPATGHDWGEWIVIREAGEETDGTAQRTCKNDPMHVEYYTIPATGATVHLAMDAKATWDPAVGEGKCYENAVIPYHIAITNTGDCPLIFDTDFGDIKNIIGPSGPVTVGTRVTLQPGEILEYDVDGTVMDLHVDKKEFYNGRTVQGTYENGGEEKHVSQFLEIVIPLTEPNEKNPQLTLTWTEDSYIKGGKGSWIPTTQDTFDADDGVVAGYTLVNSGNMPLKIVMIHKYEDGEGWHRWFFESCDPGKSKNAGFGGSQIGACITPGTDTEDLLGTATLTFYYAGYDPDTYVDRDNPGTELCRSNTITRTWKVRKPGTTPDPDPGKSQLEVSLVQGGAVNYQADPSGYQLGEVWDTTITVSNPGPVDVNKYTLRVDYTAGLEIIGEYIGGTSTDYSSWYEIPYNRGIAAGKVQDWWSWTPYGEFTAEDVARGYVYVLASVKWVDPETGADRVAYSEPLYLPTISKTGLLLTKSIEHGPANGAYFQEGESIPWTLTVTNNSKETITNVTVTDQGVVVGTFAEIKPDETFTCAVPPHTVTEYEAKVVGTVSNIATATGTDLQGIVHTYPSNPVSVPTNKYSPTPLPHTGDKDGGGGTEDPLPPGSPETPFTPGTPGGGEDPLGEIYGVSVGATVYKTTAHGPKNGEWYDEGEPVDYTVTVKNIGEVTIENLKLYDSLGGLAPIGTWPSLAPNEEHTFTFTWIVDSDNIDDGYVVNSATLTYTFLGVNGTPRNSNPVYVIAGENGHLPIDGLIMGEDGETPKIPHFPGLTTDGGTETGPDGLASCSLELEALGNTEAWYTLHACMDHKAAAEAAEEALTAGNGAEACRIWKEEIEKLYETLYKAGDGEGKAAVIEEKTAFDAYVDSYAQLAGDKAAAEVLRIKCARLCCMIHTVPDDLPESIAGNYAQMTGFGSSGETARTISELIGYDSEMTETYGAEDADALKDVMDLLNSSRSWNYDEVFRRGSQIWQIALDRQVNEDYNAADAETRKKIASWRIGLDTMAESETTLTEMLYEGNAAASAELIMNLYKDAVFDNAKGSEEDESAKLNAFIARCYTYALGRDASEWEIAYWAAAVTERGGTVTDIAHDILGSAEFMNRNLSNEEIVKALYRIYFNREADEDGLATWVNALNSGETLENVEAGFTGSEEFKVIVGE